MRHFVIVGVLVIIMTVLVNLVLTVGNLLPVEASVQAITVDQLFGVHFFLISFLFSLIFVFIAYSIVVFRAKPGETGFGKFFKSNNRLEFVWTSIPLLTVLGLSFLGSQSLAETLRSDPQAMEIKVVAFQWGWSFEYPASGVISTQLILPLNKQVLLRMTSKDVIHSFWVPEFRVKQDILPGANLEKTLRITPNQIGQYKVRCAELCGGSHAYMEAPVNVVSQADFDAFITAEMANVVTNPVDLGKKIAQTSGCISCHSLDGGKTVGPTWKGLAGSTVDLADGTQVVADDAYLKSSIQNPNLQIVKGYAANIMPKTYSTSLNDQQMGDIIAFIQSLK
jgi:cytochrome c oxidase subunit 2